MSRSSTHGADVREGKPAAVAKEAEAVTAELATSLILLALTSQESAMPRPCTLQLAAGLIIYTQIV